MNNFLYQRIFKRTQKGWPMANDCLKLLINGTDLFECLNCGIILNSRYFHGNCPNCNATDIKKCKN